MNIAYPIPEILKCIEIIHQPKKKFYKNNDKTLNLNNTAIMKKKINQTQNTFGEIVETEEFIEETFDDAKPFEIGEIIKTNNFEIKTNKKNKKPTFIIKKGNALLLTNEIANQSLSQKKNTKYIDVLEDELKLMTKITNENKDQLEKDKNLILSLNKQVAKLDEQISILREHNAQLENDFGEISKEISQQTPNKEFQTKLEIIYKQQNIIKDYQDQMSKLKDENKLLEQSTELPPSWLMGDLKFNHENDTDNASEGLSQQEYDNELKTKSKFIYEQQNIIKDYQDQISKLKDENKLLEQNSENIILQKEEMEDVAKKIKYYQDDNMRLSNELVKLSNKFETTKTQLKSFENNKSRLMSQLENLNNIISESNVIDNPFHTNISKIDNKASTDKTISNEKKITQNQSQKEITSKKTGYHKDMNRLTREIFKK